VLDIMEKVGYTVNVWGDIGGVPLPAQNLVTSYRRVTAKSASRVLRLLSPQTGGGHMRGAFCVSGGR
jgi:hypothetical protein